MSFLNTVSTFLYQNVFRKTSTFVILIGVGAVFADSAVDSAAETVFTKINEGKLWKDVKKQLNLEEPQQ